MHLRMKGKHNPFYSKIQFFPTTHYFSGLITSDNEM